jgi:hypothetical protein
MSPSSTIARAAIAFIMTVALANTARAAAASCQEAAQHLVMLIKNNWPSSDENTPAATGDMIGWIARKSSAGFAAGARRFALTYSHREFTGRAERLKPPFTPSKELLKALDNLDADMVVIGLPGTNIVATNSIGGTAHCNSTVFFSVSKGRTRVVPGPQAWNNDVGGSCGLTRSFASIDRVAFIIDDNVDSGPSMASTLTLTPWGNGKWLDPCRADFVFAPYFNTTNLQNDWVGLNNWENNDCGIEGCDGFRRGALSLVKQTQIDRAGVEDHLLAAMTASQREAYGQLKRIADRPDTAKLLPGDDDAANPATATTAAAALTDKSPLVLPMVVDGRVFLATVGHFTIGWRVFSDWKVSVETGEADHTREIARFAIGMTQGPIISATVK